MFFERGNLSDSILPYIDNDPLVVIRLINPSSGYKKDVLAYVDTGSDSIAVPKDVWDELNIESYRATTISVVGVRLQHGTLNWM